MVESRRVSLIPALREQLLLIIRSWRPLCMSCSMNVGRTDYMSVVPIMCRHSTVYRCLELFYLGSRLKVEVGEPIVSQLKRFDRQSVK